MRIRLYATLRDLAQASFIDLDVAGPLPAGMLLHQVTIDCPSLASKLWAGDRLSGQVKVLVNGRALDFLDGLETIIQPGDILSLFPPVGGG